MSDNLKGLQNIAGELRQRTKACLDVVRRAIPVNLSLVVLMDRCWRLGLLPQKLELVEL